ncbi:MAG: hypothetical protein LBO75_00330, partial [Bifidobacteriaceae bacterium]|nr:hypothetical protein [Bifidobacteriaceae bacterium]
MSGYPYLDHPPISDSSASGGSPAGAPSPASSSRLPSSGSRGRPSVLRGRQRFKGGRGFRGGRRVLAMLVAGTVAFAGAVLLQNFNTSQRAAAVTYEGSFDGVFKSDQLWSLGVYGDGNGYAQPHYTSDPGSLTVADFPSHHQVGYQLQGNEGGAACSNLTGERFLRGFAMGPILVQNGDNRLAQVFWDYNDNLGVVFSGDPNCYPVDLSGNRLNLYFYAKGGAVNPKTGEIYLADSSQYHNDSGSSYNPKVAVAQIQNTGTASVPALKLTSVTTIDDWELPYLYPPASPIYDAVIAAGKTVPKDASWQTGRDIATDAEGNVYRVVSYDAPGTDPDTWVLVRFKHPDGSDPNAWRFEVVKVLDDITAGELQGMAFSGGELYTSHKANFDVNISPVLLRWNLDTGSYESITSGDWDHWLESDGGDLGSADYSFGTSDGGVLASNSLWSINTYGDGSKPYYTANPGATVPANFAKRTKPATVPCDTNEAVGFAMGPVLLNPPYNDPSAPDDDRTAQIFWNQSGEAQISILGEETCSPVLPENSGQQYYGGGAVDPKSGQVYISDQDQTYDGDSTAQVSPYVQIGTAYHEVWDDSFHIYYQTHWNDTPVNWSGRSLYYASRLAGKRVEYNNRWEAGNDIAFDTEGNMYRLLRYQGSYYNSGEEQEIWALVRFERNPEYYGWDAEVLKIFEGDLVGPLQGLAFADGSLYTSHSPNAVVRWDLLTGSYEVLDQPTAFATGGDLGSLDGPPALVEGTIRGSYYDSAKKTWEAAVTDQDARLYSYNHNSALSGWSYVLGNWSEGEVSLNVWRQTGDQDPVLVTNALAFWDSNTKSYSYKTFLPVSEDTYYLQLTDISTMNVGEVVQTYASAGEFAAPDGTTNTVTPLCYSDAGDYQELPQSGICRGPRRDGTDWRVDASLFEGAKAVTKVTVNTDLVPARADFMLSSWKSFGDAPNTQSKVTVTPLEGGPRAVPDSLYLGDSYGYYSGEKADGSHYATDDGLFYTPKQEDDAYEASDWIPLQVKGSANSTYIGNATIVPGQEYVFRAKLSGRYATQFASDVGGAQ